MLRGLASALASTRLGPTRAGRIPILRSTPGFDHRSPSFLLNQRAYRSESGSKHSQPFIRPMDSASGRGRARGRGRGRGRPPGARGGRAIAPKAPPQSRVAAKPSLALPFCNSEYIKGRYLEPLQTPVKPSHLENPKGFLAEWIRLRTQDAPVYRTETGLIGGTIMHRATVIPDPSLSIEGVGDASSVKEAEKLAALSALLQLTAQNLLSQKSSIEALPTLSDGTSITYDTARLFMAYYCQRFRFQKPEVSLSEAKDGKGRKINGWEAIMEVAGRRLGAGYAANKRKATENCYIDVCAYLEGCDRSLWESFEEARKAGTANTAPKVTLAVSRPLEERIYGLLENIRGSTLYSRIPTNSTKDATAPDFSTQFERNRHRRKWTPRDAEEKSKQLLARHNNFKDDPAFESIREARAMLPVTAHAEEVVRLLEEGDVVVCMAATGSGKTTQLPQIILDDWIQKGKGAQCKIVCTQPRRIAAISVAQRVARERGQPVGQEVGYQVRFDTRLPHDRGSITFCTTGVLLRRLQEGVAEPGRERVLDQVTHIIVDEVHERDLDIDLLLCVLKNLAAERKGKAPIKIILVSATIDPALFRSYYEPVTKKEVPLIDVPGRQYPVTKRYLDDIVVDLKTHGNLPRWVLADPTVADYITEELGPVALAEFSPSRPPKQSRPAPEGDAPIPYPLVALTIAHAIATSQSGHVLVFLPGWQDIQAVDQILRDRTKPLLNDDLSDQSKFFIHFLHSTVPVAEQQAVFEPPPPGVRRIILATNIAETSITIPDVVYVVDTAKLKQSIHDPARHMTSLVSTWASKSNLNQRAGRAGRHRSGEYFGLLSRARADGLDTHEMVEMRRTDLSNVVMQIKSMNFGGLEAEEVLASLIEPPKPESVELAMENLQMVGALDFDKNLTSLGRVLSQLPVEVKLGRLLVYGSLFRCLEPAITLAAILSCRDPFLSPPLKRIEALEAKNRFAAPELRSDLLAVYTAYTQWETLRKNGLKREAAAFANDNFLSHLTLEAIHLQKPSLFEAIDRAGIVDASCGGVEIRRSARSMGHPALNINKDSLPVLAALLAISAQPNYAVRSHKTSYRTAHDEKTVSIASRSINHRKWDDGPVERTVYAFQEKMRNTTQAQPFTALINVTRLDALTYILFGAYKVTPGRNGLLCDGWLPIVGETVIMDDIQDLKRMMEGCMLRIFEGVYHRENDQRRARAIHRPLKFDSPEAAPDGKEDEIGEEEESDDARLGLTQGETVEFDHLMKDIVGILNQSHKEQLALQPTDASRPASPFTAPPTPAGPSPSMRGRKLPSLAPGGRSGLNTPYILSRPATPSALGRETWLR